jgi:glutamyl-tRNA reductase
LSVVVVGLEHDNAPLDVLERVTVADVDHAKVLGMLTDGENLSEAVLLSTCLRTEVYAVVDRFHDAVFEIQGLLADRAGVSAEELEPFWMIRFDDDVAVHLFEVAGGLKSAVLGEHEVLGQVRRSWERAQGEKTVGPVLGDLFRHAVQTGKRVRTETAISRGTTSFSHAAVELALGRLEGGLADKRVAVVGAGEMGKGLVDAVVGRGAGALQSLSVVNRTSERAQELAEGAASQAAIDVVPLERAVEALEHADLVFSAAEVSSPIIKVPDLAPRGDRSVRPVLVIDLGMPRNVDPSLRAIPGVTVLDMEALRESVARALEERRAEAEQARTIVAEAVAKYRAASRARGAAPIVAALRARVEAERTLEFERRRSAANDLSEEEWERVDAMTKAVLAKLLHEPTMLLKEAAGTPRGERLLEALRALFDL